MPLARNPSSANISQKPKAKIEVRLKRGPKREAERQKLTAVAKFVPCQKLNAELVFPGNELELSTLFSVLNFSQFSGDCLDRIWVPVVRSKLNASTWVYVVGNSDVAADLGAWTMADDTDIQGDLNCLHFRLLKFDFCPFFLPSGFKPTISIV